MNSNKNKISTKKLLVAGLLLGLINMVGGVPHFQGASKQSLMAALQGKNKAMLFGSSKRNLGQLQAKNLAQISQEEELDLSRGATPEDATTTDLVADIQTTDVLVDNALTDVIIDDTATKVVFDDAETVVIVEDEVKDAVVENTDTDIVDAETETEVVIDDKATNVIVENIDTDVLIDNVVVDDTAVADVVVDDTVAVVVDDTTVTGTLSDVQTEVSTDVASDLVESTGTVVEATPETTAEVVDTTDVFIADAVALESNEDITILSDQLSGSEELILQPETSYFMDSLQTGDFQALADSVQTAVTTTTTTDEVVTTDSAATAADTSVATTEEGAATTSEVVETTIIEDLSAESGVITSAIETITAPNTEIAEQVITTQQEMTAGTDDIKTAINQEFNVMASQPTVDNTATIEEIQLQSSGLLPLVSVDTETVQTLDQKELVDNLEQNVAKAVDDGLALLGYDRSSDSGVKAEVLDAFATTTTEGATATDGSTDTESFDFADTLATIIDEAATTTTESTSIEVITTEVVETEAEALAITSTDDAGTIVEEPLIATEDSSLTTGGFLTGSSE